jgi:hypothetical protein
MKLPRGGFIVFKLLINNYLLDGKYRYFFID